MWWDGTLRLPKADEMIGRWGSQEFSTDWGIRDISNQTPFYDPISYHQGSIWPLFTGWASLAEYRAGHPLAGYAHLMHNANLTGAQDLGSVTQLLSGDYYQPLGRSSSHQMWSSAMVIAPLVRGLFGITWDAPAHKMAINPHLPADWTSATLRNLPFEGKQIDIAMKRQGNGWMIQVTGKEAVNLCLTTDINSWCQPANSRQHTSRAEALPVELSLPVRIPDEGATSSQVKVVGEEYGPREAVISLSALGGTKLLLPVRFSHPGTTVEGASNMNSNLEVTFPAGAGWSTKRMVFRW